MRSAMAERPGPLADSARLPLPSLTPALHRRPVIRLTLGRLRYRSFVADLGLPVPQFNAGDGCNITAKIFDLLGRDRAGGIKLNRVGSTNKDVEELLRAKGPLDDEALDKLLKAELESHCGM